MWLEKFKKYIFKIQKLLGLNKYEILVTNKIPNDMESKGRIIMNDRKAIVYLNENFDNGEYFKNDWALKSVALHEMLHLFFHNNDIKFKDILQEEDVIMKLTILFIHFYELDEN